MSLGKCPKIDPATGVRPGASWLPNFKLLRTIRFFVKIGLCLRRDGALLQRRMVPWPTDSTLLRTTSGTVSSQVRMGVVSSLLLIQGRRNTLQHTATHCNSLQLTATHCNALQHIAIRCMSIQGDMGVIVSLVRT